MQVLVMLTTKQLAVYTTDETALHGTFVAVQIPAKVPSLSRCHGWNMTVCVYVREGNVSA
jgi:hypothetical protein